MTVLYLNPIFAAPSNHRYDTSDYFYVDPDLGLRPSSRLWSARPRPGIRVVLDGVFNHVPSDSPWFDRFGDYETVGACECGRLALPRLVHLPFTGSRPARALRASEPGGDDTDYRSWASSTRFPS